ncbi:MAG: hypothetical protein Q7V88_12020 [Actinomycetota bacterium]|nr:hypothetical protein [Actinomycetota bacterium]
MKRRFLITFLLAIAALPVAVLSSTQPAAAAGGLAISSTTTYTIDAQSGVVHVLAEMTFTNTIPDVRDGYYINRRYFTGFSLPAPAGALNPTATSSSGRGLGLNPRFVDGNTNYVVYDVDFASNLFYQQTARVNVAYDITGLPPRSQNPSRVNAAYAAFDAWGIGDDGKVTVRVVVPAGFTIDTFGDDAVVTEEFGYTVYTATNIPNPDEFNIFVSARNDGGLTDIDITTADGDVFNLRAWPGDTEWQQFVTTQIEDGVPVLVELVGQEWPIDESVEVREAFTPYLYGYAGWFSADDNELEVGEDLDAEVVLHELSHAWFNDELIQERWLSEGLAQVYSNMAVDDMGGDALEPHTIRSNDAGKVTLNQWPDPSFVDGADEVEEYGYNASFSVVQQIVDEVGEENMRAVLAAMVDGTLPYLGDAPAEQVSGVADWRRFLDLVEELGGATKAQELYEKWVATAAQRDMLEQRALARDDYHALAEAGGEWAPPEVVRRKMTLWAFENVDVLIGDANEVLALRDELDGKAAELESTYPADLEAAYEAADKNLDDAAAAVQAQIDTADEVLAAVAADQRDDGLFGKVGLLGTNLPGLLSDAKAAFAAGDHDLARAKAQEVLDTVRKAPDVGKTRSLWVGCGVLLFLLLLILLIVLLRRRKRRARAQLAAQENAAAVGELDPTTDRPFDSVPAGGVAGDPTLFVPVPTPSFDTIVPGDTVDDSGGDSSGDSGGDSSGDGSD